MGTSVSTFVKHGIVRAVGPGRVNDKATSSYGELNSDNNLMTPVRTKMSIQVGQKVVFPFKSIPVKANGREYFLIGEVEVLGVLSD